MVDRLCRPPNNSPKRHSKIPSFDQSKSFPFKVSKGQIPIHPPILPSTFVSNHSASTKAVESFPDPVPSRLSTLPPSLTSTWSFRIIQSKVFPFTSLHSHRHSNTSSSTSSDTMKLHTYQATLPARRKKSDSPSTPSLPFPTFALSPFVISLGLRSRYSGRLSSLVRDSSKSISQGVCGFSTISIRRMERFGRIIVTPSSHSSRSTENLSHSNL